MSPDDVDKVIRYITNLIITLTFNHDSQERFSS